MKRSRKDFTEKDHFVIEAAIQLGFEVVDDDIELFQVSDEDLVEFARRLIETAYLRGVNDEAETQAKIRRENGKNHLQ